MRNNVWIKLAAVSLMGLLLSVVILCGINGLTQNRYNNGYRTRQGGYNNTQMQGNMNMQQAPPQQSQGGMMNGGM